MLAGIWTLLFAILRAGVEEPGLAFHFSSWDPEQSGRYAHGQGGRLHPSITLAHLTCISGPVWAICKHWMPGVREAACGYGKDYPRAQLIGPQGSGPDDPWLVSTAFGLLRSGLVLTFP